MANHSKKIPPRKVQKVEQHPAVRLLEFFSKLIRWLLMLKTLLDQLTELFV
jgi:hypothetical protein